MAQKGRWLYAPIDAKKPETLNCSLQLRKKSPKCQFIFHHVKSAGEHQKKMLTSSPTSQWSRERSLHCSKSPYCEVWWVVFVFVFFLLSVHTLRVLPYPDLHFLVKKSNFNEAFTFLPLKYQPASQPKRESANLLLFSILLLFRQSSNSCWLDSEVLNSSIEKLWLPCLIFLIAKPGNLSGWISLVSKAVFNFRLKFKEVRCVYVWWHHICFEGLLIC